jgi:predicted neuraminidase
LLTYPGDGIRALCRSKQGVITEIRSADGGMTWSSMMNTGLPNPNSGIDGVTLANGQQLLVYNHTAKGRSPLNFAVFTEDEGWRSVLTLEQGSGEFSHPAVIQSADGRIHIT